MLKEYKITWRHREQYGYKCEQYFNCYATSEGQAKSYFREQHGFDGKRIMRVESFKYERKY